MRNAMLGGVSALALATPSLAADLPVQPRYSEGPSFEYRSAPPAIVEEAVPVVPETYVVRRPVVVPPPHVVVEEYPIYVPPPVYAAPPVYAYAGPGWRGGWGHRGHLRGRW